MAIDRKDLLAWLRDYCNQDFNDSVDDWIDETEYKIGDYVVADNDHVYKSKTNHTANDDPPPANETDWDYTEETVPAGIRVALDKLEEYMKVDLSIQSETLGDYSRTYSLATNWANFPPHIRSMLRPYRKVGFA